jgi:very-short-patch-repair endonuclease
VRVLGLSKHDDFNDSSATSSFLPRIVSVSHHPQTCDCPSMADLTPPRLIAKKSLVRSRALRRESTIAEKRLWSILQNRKLDGWKFRRQVAIESFIVDFCCMEARLVVELDGEQHAVARKSYDDARTLELRALGYDCCCT